MCSLWAWQRVESRSADEPLGPPVVATTFGLGAGPTHDVASDPSTHKAYVTSEGDDSLYVADAKSRVTTIRVGTAPWFAAVDPTTQTAYVTSGNSVSVVNIGSGSITGTIGVGASPEGIEVDSSTRKVYVANSGDDTVSVIDAESRRVTATIKVGSRPGKMGVDPTTHLLYVSNRGSSTVSEWSVSTIGGRNPNDVAIDPPTRTAQTIAVGLQPSAATVDSDAHTVFVTNSGAASVSVIDSQKRSVTDTVDVGDGPQTVAADPSTHTAWVVNLRGNSISVIER